jgi:hypothetical protein
VITAWKEKIKVKIARDAMSEDNEISTRNQTLRTTSMRPPQRKKPLGSFFNHHHHQYNYPPHIPEDLKNFWEEPKDKFFDRSIFDRNSPSHFRYIKFIVELLHKECSYQSNLPLFQKNPSLYGFPRFDGNW